MPHFLASSGHSEPSRMIRSGVPVGVWGRFVWFDAAVASITLWTPAVMLALVVWPSLWSHGAAHEAAIRGAWASIGSAILGRLINQPLARWVDKRRPFERNVIVPLVSHDRGDALPSNHATGAFALAMGMVHVYPVNGILIVLAVLLCLSRVYCGVHDVFDVTAGAIHGTLLGLLISLFLQCTAWMP